MSGGRRLGAGLSAAAAGGLTWLFHLRYWAHRDCIAEALSSCVVIRPDGSQDNLTHGGLLWRALALPLWLMAAWLLLRPGPRA